MTAAELNSEVVDRYIEEEVSCNRLVEVQSHFAGSVHISKLGVIPKKHQPGKWRMIVDLSSPSGASVNDFIDPSLCSLKYASVDDAAEFVEKVGRGALLAKLDIKSAYRNIPIHPGDRHLFGIQWRGRTYIDSCLPFGLRSAPKIFNATADALECIEGEGVLNLSSTTSTISCLVGAQDRIPVQVHWASHYKSVVKLVSLS